MRQPSLSERIHPLDPMGFRESSADILPSAPPLPARDSHLVHVAHTAVESMDSLLSMPAPSWEPDSSSQHCRECDRPFWYCPCFLGLHDSKHSTMQKVCAVILEPLQPAIAETCSEANRPAFRDVLDWSVPRFWFNAPYMQPFPLEIYK
eukprot:scaffold46803_cov43-Prasinocladus_malaysianus.AAC.1